MKFKISKSKIQGLGAFALKDIKPGKTICIMKGKEITIPQIKKFYSSGKERTGDPFQISPTTYLDLKQKFVCINHSCNPNATIINKSKLISIKPIKKGEEITYDYSLVMHEYLPENISIWGPGWQDWEIPCKCKAKNCRKKITNFNKLPRAIKNKAIKNRFLQTYILKLYKNK